MPGLLKKILKWIGIVTAAVIVLILLDVALLMTPGPFFAESKQYGAITVYSQTPIGPETDSIMAEVFTRLEAVPVYDPDRKNNLSFCSTQDKFSFFARLTLRDNRIMGFSLWHNSYVNEDYVKELRVTTGGRPRYLTREGSIVHVATHELMHEYLADAYGSLASRSLPGWKVEGYCEYGVNQYVAPRDSGFTIPERIDILLDDSRWNPTARVHRPHYRWGLIMEYLINVEGMSFDDVMADEVTQETAYQRMMAWRRSLDDSAPESTY